MSDPSSILPPPSPPPFDGQHPAGHGESMSPQEINDGKVLAALCYPIWIIALVMIFVRNNSFALYHAKQMMALVIAQFVIMIPLTGCFCFSGLFMGPAAGHASNRGGAAFAAMPCMILLVWLAAAVISIAHLVLMIIGLVNAIKGEAKPLPLIGGLAETLFGNLHKKPL